MNNQISFKTIIPKPIIIYLISVTVAVVSVLALSILLKILEEKSSSKPINHNIPPQNYAFLVALSKTYVNYRHQSDVFRAYKILSQSGIHRDNIITFAYNDVAYDKNNPFPGKIFNKPDFYGKGSDNYELVKDNIDYQKTAVNKLNILNALLGKSSLLSKQKVLVTTEKDNVFIFMSGHGGTGFLVLPDGQKLFADEFNAALQQLISKKVFNKLVFYLEACESGSMFDGYLNSTMNVYAVSASDPYTPSYAYFCGKPIVNRRSIGSCLSDEFANSWMDTTEQQIRENNFTYTLGNQWVEIRNRVANSKPHSYGNLNFRRESIFEFHTNKTYLYTKNQNDHDNKKQEIEELIEYSNNNNNNNEFEGSFIYDNFENFENLTEKKEKFTIKPNYKVLYLQSLLNHLQENMKNKTEKSSNETSDLITFKSLKLKNLKSLIEEEEDEEEDSINIIDNYTEEDITQLQQELNNEIIHHNKTDVFFEKYKQHFGIDSKLKQKLKTSDINFKCYREVIDYYETTCLDYSEYAIQYYKYFSISCSNNNSNNLDIDSELDSESLNEKDIIKVIDELCKLLI